MVLVHYSDSDSDEQSADDPQAPVAKRRKTAQDASRSASPPPLPPAFMSLYTTSARLSTSDDPSLHGGRQRVVPHVEGNWAAHVYLEFMPSPTQSTLLTSLITSTTLLHPKHTLTSHLTDSTSVSQPLHISLSAPLILTPRTKPLFLPRITTALTQLVPSLGPRLSLRPASLHFFPNASGARSFLVLTLHPPDEHPLALAQLSGGACDSVARELGCATLGYAHASGASGAAGAGHGEREAGRQRFHVSIASVLGRVEGAVPASADAVGGTGSTATAVGEISAALDELGTTRFVFADVKVKLGKDVTSLPLGSRWTGRGAAAAAGTAPRTGRARP